MSFLKRTLFCLPFLFPFNLSATDYLLLGTPKAYVILNSYEQPLSEEEWKRFPSNTPGRVLNKTVTLGDGISKALSFELDEENYFLQKDDNGRFTASGTASQKHLMFKNCQQIKDTIIVTKNRKVLFGQGIKQNTPGTFLEEGDELLRLFKYHGKFFLKKLSGEQNWGWTSLSSRSVWKQKKERTAKKEAHLSQELIKQIKEKLSFANKSYHQFYTAFNKLSGTARKPPLWQYSVNKNTVRCILKGSPELPEQLKNSNKVLAGEIENLVMGQPFIVRFRNGEITIMANN
ncbi:MAG: hypothetical protein HQK83_06675 [Fibrobacteria bacterium]|nr:hypothetical protein [Fibrobacteria bacterium]